MMGLLYQKLGDDKESLKWAQNAYYHPKNKTTDNFTQWSAMFLLAQEHERLNNLDSSYHFAMENGGLFKNVIFQCRKVIHADTGPHR